MTSRGTKAQESLVIALDGDKLGQIGGITLALSVMAFCFFWREADLTTTTMRSGWAFVVGYGATFFLTRTILRTALTEMIAADNAGRPKGLSRISPAKEEEDAAATMDLEDLGLQPLAGREDTSLSVLSDDED